MNTQTIPHTVWMRRCLELAALGAGYTAPNPMVGAVLVYNNHIIGEGYHQQYGQPHAEVNAINSVLPQYKHLIEQATLYVSLEPCSHFGKTPPCTNLIIANNIKQVVVATTDPNPVVAGRGIELLKKQGIAVTTGILEQEAQWLNRRFFWFHTARRPWIVLKWAQTADLFFAKQRNLQSWITNSFSKTLVHRWRSEEQSILVGTNTAQTDNPQLNVRSWFGKSPLRLVLDRQLRLGKTLHLFTDKIPTLVFTQQPPPPNSSAYLTYIQVNFENNLLSQISDRLHHLQIQSVFVEGGRQLLNSFIEQNLWNEARIITGNQYWGSGIEAPRLPPEANLINSANLHNNNIQEWVNTIR